jgi:hypothetical protein
VEPSNRPDGRFDMCRKERQRDIRIGHGLSPLREMTRCAYAAAQPLFATPSLALEEALPRLGGSFASPGQARTLPSWSGPLARVSARAPRRPSVTGRRSSRRQASGRAFCAPPLSKSRGPSGAASQFLHYGGNGRALFAVEDRKHLSLLRVRPAGVV